MSTAADRVDFVKMTAAERVDSSTRMTQSEIATWIIAMSKIFNVPEPMVYLNKRRTVSAYSWHPLKVECGQPDGMKIHLYKGFMQSFRKNQMHILCHEFAHHIDACRQFRDYQTVNMRHDKRFLRLLLNVVDVVYGDRALYPWEWEYRSIKNATTPYWLPQKQRFAAAAKQVFNRLDDTGV